MTRLPSIRCLCLAALLAAAPQAGAQTRPYIGFAYPAGGRQGATFDVKLGGQNLGDVNQVLVTGQGVTAKVVHYERKLSPQDVNVLREQLAELKKSLPKPPAKPKPAATPPAAKPTPPPPPPQPSAKPATPPAAQPAAQPAAKPAPTAAAAKPAAAEPDPATLRLIAKIEQRVAEYVNQPAVQSIANLAYIEVTIAADAPPGERELRLTTPQGVSNPLPFHIGQLPEYQRKPMLTSNFQVLGKESLAQRKRPDEEIEVKVELPCTVNGQVASGEVNLYRFSASKGQQLVFSAAARRLVPYIADAVPGWFQPVLRLCDAAGNEVAYQDDFRFNPDPAIFYQIPRDGEYVLGIYDSIYRGREDFVYRISMGELPFVTHIFPLGGRAGAPPAVAMKGWNLDGATLAQPAPNAAPGRHFLAARKGNLASNPVPFELDTLPECSEREPDNGDPAAQQVTLPMIINGRIDQPGDRDVFEFTGRAGDPVVAEVTARRLGSPADSSLMLTDANGTVLAFNDDSEDRGSGLNTHHADSYFTTKLPADGTYRVHIWETARAGGGEYAYRLRISAPQPDFELRIVPSSLTIKGKSSGRVTVYAIRKDGFKETIKLELKDAPAGFSAAPVSLGPNSESAAFTIKTDLADSGLKPVRLNVQGTAGAEGKQVVRPAVPAEDRMQAFLWRHLVPAEDFQVLVWDPAYKAPLKRPLPIEVSIK